MLLRVAMFAIGCVLLALAVYGWQQWPGTFPWPMVKGGLVGAGAVSILMAVVGRKRPPVG